MNWTKSPNQDFEKDDRGWPKGKRRKWTKQDEQRIKELHKTLTNDPYQFYTGPTAVKQEWQQTYPNYPCPPLRTIGKMMADLGLSGKRTKDRHQGAARYLCYPEYTIYNLLGGRVLELDFIGEKYIKGRTKPLNFIAFAFKKEPRLRYFQRVSAQRSDNVIQECRHFFDKFEKPDYIKVDNAAATIGSTSAKRNISRVMMFLLERQVIPIFAVPRKPWSQASIEGNNSVFARKFWNRIEFNSIQEIEEKLEWFNQSSLKYTGYKPPQKKCKHWQRGFIPQVYFTRQVKEDKREEKDQGLIEVLHEIIPIHKSFINYFVLAIWNLRKEDLSVYFEKEQESILIKKLSFKINSTSKKRCTDFI